MGTKTDVSWANASWNPWQGCRKVSQGCKNCYMFRDMKRYGRDAGNVHRSSNATFNMPLGLPKGQRVFVCSWSDFWIEEADEWREEAFSVMRLRPDLQFLIPTKRVERIAAHLPAHWETAYANVWLGASVENQAAADERGPMLANIPAAIHWLSVEPMLGPVELYQAWAIEMEWVVCGGESGPDHRPMELSWARDLRDNCRGNLTAFFMKQAAGRKPGDYASLPDDLHVREFPRGAR